MDVLRTMVMDDPRAQRAFVTGPADVQSWDSSWGLPREDYQPAEYVNYPATSNAVYACINARTKALSSLPIKLYSKKMDANGKRTEITSGPAWDLLQSINPYWTFGRWVEMTEQSLCVWGESFTFYATRGNRPVEMWWARADEVKVHPSSDGYISHFTYDPGRGGKPIRFEREETLWLRYPNVANQWAGLSPLAAARLSADAASAAMKSNNAIFRNGLTAAGMISPQQGTNLSDDQAKDVARLLTSRFKGMENAHRVAVLKFGVDVKQLSINPKDAEFLGMLNWSLEDVARAYAVPIDKIGGKRTYQNVDDSERVFWSDCIIPEAKFIAAEITEQLLPLFGGGMVAEFDDSDVSALHEAESAEWERWEGQINIGARLLNEYRAEKGLEPVPWGDVWWAQGTLIPIDSEEKPEPQLPVALAANTGDPDADNSKQDTERRRNTRAAAYGSAEHEARWRAHVDQTETWEQRIGAETARLMGDQMQSVLARLRQRGARAAEDLLLSPFDEGRWIKAFRIALRPVIEGVYREAGELARDQLGFAFAFDVQDPNVIRAIETQVQRFAVEVNNTTWQALQTSLAEGVSDGETIDQLAERINGIMGDRIRSSKDTIARTETTTASTTGTLESWRQSGVVVGKEWLAAIDDRTRESHVAAHGQRVGLNDSFTVGAATGTGPGNMGSARENVNCRCTIVPVLDTEGL